MNIFNKKILLLIAVIFLLLIILVILRLIQKNTNTNQSQPLPIPVFNNQSNKTNQESITPQTNENTKYTQIISVNPKEDTSLKYLFSSQIELTFDKPVIPTQFVYQITPYVENYAILKKGTNNVIILAPKTVWNVGITNIKIIQDQNSSATYFLKSPYIYSINTAFPDNPPANLHEDLP